MAAKGRRALPRVGRPHNGRAMMTAARRSTSARLPLQDGQTQRQGRRTERLGSEAGGSADLSKIVREVRFLAGGDVRSLALATISLAEVVAA